MVKLRTLRVLLHILGIETPYYCPNCEKFGAYRRGNRMKCHYCSFNIKRPEGSTFHRELSNRIRIKWEGELTSS